MKILALVVLALSATAHAERPIDYTFCNDTINKAFQTNKNFPYGYIQITPAGKIEAAQCGEGRSRCTMNSFIRYGIKEEYKVSQDPTIGAFKKMDRIFEIIRGNDGRITKIKSESDELQISYTDNKCVATTLIADIPDENIREMNFDLVACKTFHEIQKRFGSKLSACFTKDVETIKTSSNKDLRKFGGGCATELKEVYKSLVSLKADIISRYEGDKSLKRKPFQNIVPPSVFNDQVIENFICSYEATMSAPTESKECAQQIFEMSNPTDTALGVILGNKKTCGLIYSDATMDSDEIFKQKYVTSLVYTFQEANSGSGSVASRGTTGKKAKSE